MNRDTGTYRLFHKTGKLQGKNRLKKFPVDAGFLHDNMNMTSTVLTDMMQYAPCMTCVS